MVNQVDTEGIRMQEAVLKALKNMGHDTTCGACMSIAFTGTSTGQHTCKRLSACSDNGMLSVDDFIKALEVNRTDLERWPPAPLIFLQSAIATNFKDMGMPKEVYLQGCEQAWDQLQEIETIPRNTH